MASNYPTGMDMGFRPTGYSQGIEQGLEDRYSRAIKNKMMEDLAVQQAQEALKAQDQHNQILEQAKTSAQTRAYQQAVMDQMKAKQSSTQEENMYGPISTIAELANRQSPNKMQDMVDAARMYNELEASGQLPKSYTSMMSKEAQFKDPNTGQSIISKFNPEVLSILANNAARSKNIAGLQGTQIKTDASTQNNQDRIASAERIAGMKNAFMLSLQQEKDHNKAQTAYQDFRQLNAAVEQGLPGAEQRLEQWLNNYNQMKPASLTPSIPGIDTTANRPPVQVSNAAAPVSEEWVRDPKTGKLTRK